MLLSPESPAEIEAVRQAFRDYAHALGVDLGFQNFEDELAGLPGDYAPPRGALLLALVPLGSNDSPVPVFASTATTPDAGADEARVPNTAPTLDIEGRPALVAGCCALRPLDAVDYPNAAEMKRLFVRPGFRGLGVGRQLVEAMLDLARAAAYDCVLLDTLDDMEAARSLYEEVGFTEVPPYYHNPIAGAHYLRVEL